MRKKKQFLSPHSYGLIDNKWTKFKPLNQDLNQFFETRTEKTPEKLSLN